MITSSTTSDYFDCRENWPSSFSVGKHRLAKHSEDASLFLNAAALTIETREHLLQGPPATMQTHLLLPHLSPSFYQGQTFLSHFFGMHPRCCIAFSRNPSFLSCPISAHANTISSTLGLNSTSSSVGRVHSAEDVNLRAHSSKGSYRSAAALGRWQT